MISKYHIGRDDDSPHLSNVEKILSATTGLIPADLTMPFRSCPDDLNCAVMHWTYSKSKSKAFFLSPSVSRFDLLLTKTPKQLNKRFLVFRGKNKGETAKRHNDIPKGDN